MIRITTLLSGHGLAALSTLARNLVLARILGPQDYGVAVALVVVIAAAELTTTLGLPQQIVSHKHGAGRQFQATLHTVQIARGLLGAGIILLTATPLANVLGAPDAAPILRTAALVPTILGFIHLDPFRAQRHRRHLPQILVLAVPPMVCVLAIWPMSGWQDGPSLMLDLLLVQAFMSVAISHLIAVRPYRLKFHMSQIQQVLRYGLPLAANGILMFAVLHAEKLIAGAGLGLVEMGVLAMGFTLTLTPALIMARSFQAFYLPKLRNEREQVLGLAMMLGASLSVVLTTLVPLCLPVLGAGFGGLAELIPILSCLAALRLPKSALATVALAEGCTNLPAVANLPRVLGTPLVWLALGWGGDVKTLLVIATTAEVAGVGLGILISRTKQLPVRATAIAALVGVLVLSGQHGLAIFACGIGWMLYAFSPTPFLTRRTT
ncbi:O-antigen/teichoic acid export membrane protein [Litoreibacter meonggei]|uniref:O-antigen/teichoic acid export membrane protein n=1 Tax=Litoreibacter meonggei TaxID=1049199 RepID=A0A497VGS6_9RHOB|nr:oligosaccharide flippase family protein [Litoreibacter meonggei]RLJ41427.1 O-antigen/teichoic acid export membrane protein [Litoreibacter meonggei]